MAIYAERPSGAPQGKKAAPAGGESGRRAHGPALGGEAGSVRLKPIRIGLAKEPPCSVS